MYHGSKFIVAFWRVHRRFGHALAQAPVTCCSPPSNEESTTL
jgi:hypothetical protein